MASQTAYSTWTPQKPTLFDGHYLRNRSTLDIGVFGYIGIVLHKKHSPEVLSIPPGTLYIRIQYQVIVYYLVMNKGLWGGRGAEFLKSGAVVGWNVSFLFSGNVTR